jgi:glycerophosphoryl diester phosphodiesterase
MNPHPLRAGAHFACAVFVTALVSAANPGAVESDWNIVDHLPLERVIIQSHRGAGVLAEENTVAAFELGWKLGTYPECDLRTTSDGVIVTFHDANFSRVVKSVSPELAQKGVKDLTYAELLKLDVGAWRGDKFVGRRVSKLTDVFAVMRGRPERHLYLDIKNVDFKQLAQEVRAYGVEQQIILASPNPEQIREWKTLVPDSETLLWMRGSEAQLRQRLAELRKTGFAGITELQLHIFPNQSIEEALALAAIPASRIEVDIEKAKISAEPFTLSQGFIVELGRELHAQSILLQALPYTPDPTIYARLLDLGFASFATDHPDVTLRELKAYYDRKPSRPRG